HVEAHPERQKHRLKRDHESVDGLAEARGEQLFGHFLGVHAAPFPFSTWSRSQSTSALMSTTCLCSHCTRMRTSVSEPSVSFFTSNDSEIACRISFLISVFVLASNFSHHSFGP